MTKLKDVDAIIESLIEDGTLEESGKPLTESDALHYMKNKKQVDNALDDLESALEDAIQECKKLKGVAPGGMSLRIERYTLAHLKAWLEDERQTGSVASLREELEELEDEAKDED